MSETATARHPERLSLLGRNEPARFLPGPRTLHGLFAAQAARTPEATALIHGTRRWSYAELRRASAVVAARLLPLGAGPERRVGVLLERTPALIPALLGVLETGAAYVPLDPAYPADRVRFMLEDSGAVALLAGPGLAETLALPSLPTRLLTEAIFTEAADPSPGILPDPDPDHLAYLIYTSGSTGRPKGVAIAHASAAALLGWAADEFPPAELAGVLAATSVCFDLSVFEIFLPLARGGAVILAKDALELLQLPAAAEVTLVNTVPSAAAELVRAGAVPPGVATFNLAGEPLRRELVERLYASGTIAKVWNLYGPSEDTTYSTAGPVEPGAGLPVTIGRPIAGTSAHLVDRALAAVAAGEPGELLLGGAGLARGYLGRPALTAERFVPDPFSGLAGSRLYRTGDLARRLPDGRIEFLGRLDHQVKLRGFRIELGEVESALARAAGTLDAVAVVREDLPGDPRLVAYWVPEAGRPERDAVALRADLARTLPAYMLPAHLVLLESLPRTPNGKVDRARLPAPSLDRAAVLAEGPGGGLPEGAEERAVAAIWQELTGIERIGSGENFFELGGHSLLAARAATRLRDAFGVDLAPVDLFRAPTVAALAAVVRERRVGPAGGHETGRPGAPAALPPLTRAPRGGRVPLSFPQEQIWIISQLAPDNLAYNFQYTVRFRGPLSPALLARTLSEIVRRHEVLWTSFHEVDGEPLQRPEAPWAARLPEVDLSALPAERREGTAEALVAPLVRRRFDPSRLPLVAWALLRLEARDHLMVQVEHHFVHDGWSIAVILGEISTLYADFAAGRPPSLPELPVQFADFVLWQRGWLAGEILERELAWWRDELAGVPAGLDLPGDRPRPAAQTFAGDRLDVDLPPDLYAAVRGFVRRQGSTLFIAMLAAFEALLHRITGRDRFLLGSGVANRRVRELEGLIGMIVNTLVVKADVAGDPTVAELLARVRETVVGLQAHPDVPFEKLVAALEPERDLSRNPLFQHLFSFHDAPVPDLDFAGLHGTLVERHNGSAKADFNIIVKPRAEQRIGRAPSDEDALLRVLWEFSTDLFDRATVERMWGHYQVVLAAMIAEPTARVSALPLLTAAERAELAAWSRPAPPHAVGVPVALRVLAQAGERPLAPALAAAGRTWTYGELAGTALRVAGTLARRGTGPEAVVATLFRPSPEMVAAQLGVQLAGAAYLPLDPDHPADRLRYQVEDAGAAALIAEDGIVPEGLAGDPAASGVPVVAFADAAHGEPAAPALLEPDGLAYVIYTSGSTGRPKGTALTHGGLAGLVAWHLETYGLSPEDRVSQVANPAFDATVWEVWPALSAGALVAFPPPELRRAPGELLRWLAAEGITLAFLPTPLAEAALDEEAPPGLALRAVLTGGDALHRRPPRGLPYALINHYGPTEATVVATAGRVVPGRARTSPDIGRPIAGTRAAVVDSRRRPVPVGIPGELCLAGPSLARGYLGRPALTAERFVPDPDSPEPGGRLYRTGDLVRWRPDGRLQFLGRGDRQVKIRGFRIELGEIEAALAARPGVDRAVALAVDGRLVAFAASSGVPPPAAEALRRSLAETLPEVMVPTAVEVVDALPLTGRGKIDRAELARRAAALSALVGRRPAARPAPASPVAQVAAAIWAELLSLPPDRPVAADDNFFDLGGHSLLATRATAHVGAAVGIELPLSLPFVWPTLERFAAAVEARLAGGGEPPGPIPRVSRHPDPPASYGQERLWVVDRLIADPAAYHVARAWKLAGPLDPAALAAAATAVARRQEALRTVFTLTGDGLRQRALPPAPVPLPTVDLAALPADARATSEGRLLRGAVRRPFDLSAEAPWRLLLVRRGVEDHLLVLTLHHVAADGWSLPILFGELGAAYAAALRRRPAALPALPVQIADFAAWQRRRLTGEILGRLVEGWREALAGAPPALALATDRPRPAVQSFRGARVTRTLGPDESADLHLAARAAGATPFMALLAAFAAVLGRFAEQDDVVVGSPIAGRQRPELEGLVGFFVNTLALRVRLGGAPTFRELLGRVRAANLAAYARSELPFERLVDVLAPERDLGRSPLFQTTLAFQNTAPEALALAGLEVEARPIAREETHFDLTLFAEPRAGALELSLAYARDLFDRATAEALLGALVSLAGAAAADPERRPAELPLLDGAARWEVAAGGAARPPRPAERPAAARALPAVAPPVPPSTPEEARMAALWAELLGLETVGIHDHFFALGGNSLLAARLTSGVAAAFGVDLPLPAVFECPTVAELTARVAAAAAGPPATPAIRGVARRAVARRPESAG